jgi:hypothetical protein
MNQTNRRKRDSKPDCKTCEAMQERLAIMIIDGKMERREAIKEARKIICLGCDGALGWGLFDGR